MQELAKTGGTASIIPARRLRFGLGGLVLFVLFLASLAAVWQRREAWVCMGPHLDPWPMQSALFRSQDLDLPNPPPKGDIVGHLSLTTDEEVVYVHEKGGWAIVWEKSYGVRIRIMQELYDSMHAASFTFSPKGKTFLMHNRPFKLFELHSLSQQRQLATFRQYPHYSADGTYVLVVEPEDTLKVFAAETGKLVHAFQPFGSFKLEDAIDEELQNISQGRGPAFVSWISSLLPSLRGNPAKELVVMARKGQVIAFNFITGEVQALIKSDADPNSIGDACISEDQARCYLFGARLLAWDLQQNKLLFDIELECHSIFDASQPDRLIVTLGKYALPQQNYVLVDAVDGKILFRPPTCVSIHFLDADTMLLVPVKNAANRPPELWCRRHPEWWWGHFYRPEVWVAFVFGALCLWRVWRTLKAGWVIA